MTAPVRSIDARIGARLPVDRNGPLPVTCWCEGEPTDQAKAVCAGCSVRAECLDYAIETTARFGIWGGCSERDRRVLRGQRARARAAQRRAAS